ncbi:MAG: CoA transferase [Acidobacteriota bacterium]|nr:CoA transferase [Acidobacteriota bacterium]
MSLLEGLRVVDAGKILAAPLAGQILADMGAEVLKIEPPDGDPTRGWGPPFHRDTAAYYQCCNRNKDSLVLNLKQEADMTRFRRLLERADVLLHNFLPSGRKKFALTRAEVTRDFPRLVTMGVTGFRVGTSRENEAGYDAALQGEIGLMSLNGPPEDGPYKVGVAIVDVLTGMMAANGALAALFRRSRTGEGAYLNVSLYQTGMFSLINVGSAFHLTGEPPGRYGNAHPNIVPYQPFRLADRDVVIAVGNDKQYADLCRILKLPVDHETNRKRVENRKEVLDRLSKAMADLHSDTFLNLLNEARVPATPVLTVEESFSRAAAWDSDAVIALEHSILGTLKTTAFPVTGFAAPAYRPPPMQNEGGEALAARWLEE